MMFYLGTHETHWLASAAFPLFVSHMRLARRRTLPRAACRWALDSGGFTQLQQHGGWTITPKAYAAAVRRYASEIGNLDFAAPQDWMCEPFMVERTGYTVTRHQILTMNNYLELRTIAPDLPFVPVLQGWQPSDYLRHMDMYASAGIGLAALPLVGLGSVCRRQDTGEADAIVRSLAPLRLHGFGVKTAGLARFGHRLTSADSMAWSYDARRNAPLPGCTHRNCANCVHWAMRWRQRVLASMVTAGRQGDLFDPDEAWNAHDRAAAGTATGRMAAGAAGTGGTMSTIPWTAEQLTQGIANAIKARNFEAVHDFLRLLAVVDPQRAQDVMDTIDAGLLIAERSQP